MDSTMTASLFEYGVMSPLETCNPDVFLYHPTSDQSLDPPHLYTFPAHARIFRLDMNSLVSRFCKLFKSTAAKPVVSPSSGPHAVLAPPRLIVWQERARMDYLRTNSSTTNVMRSLNSIQSEFADSSSTPASLPITQTTASLTIDDEEKRAPIKSPTSFCSRSLSLAKLDTTTVGSNVTLVHTFPAPRVPADRNSHSGLPHRAMENRLPRSIPERQYNHLSNTTCAVCMEPIGLQNDNLKLTCGHRFHAERCIIPWLTQNASCPVCRFRLVIDPIFRVNNPTLPDHLYRAYMDLVTRSSANSTPSAGREASTSAFPRRVDAHSLALSQNSNQTDTAIVTATIWDSYSRFMM